MALIDKKGKLRTETQQMTKIATEYHEELQKRPEMTEEREEAIKKMVEITTRELSEEQQEYMEQGIQIEEITEAVKVAPRGTTPGTDGIPYEFYKMWNEPRDEEESEESEEPDILNILKMME
ncbi:hypothetical protein BDZ94DRAFT_1315818 [Collybia nuda]|uniref:Uncharacterized protein n=1 Tax=Collybia nuda TaxID=64659 RepID=A0A9P6C835_9AGAR|nr:hypothetical protein BDZ94DRAFT_1315818 [Collybia nuda]